MYDHKGAHVVPRGQEAMEDLTAALNWVVDRAMYHRQKRIARVIERQRQSAAEFPLHAHQEKIEDS